MRSWIAAIVSLAEVVMIVHDRMKGRSSPSSASRLSGRSAVLGAPPDLPQPGEGQRLVVGPVDEVRLLLAVPGHLRPLVEAVGRDDAAARAKGAGRRSWWRSSRPGR